MLFSAVFFTRTGPNVCVRVISLVSGTVTALLLEGPSGGHPTTVATGSRVDTVDELLLGVDGEVTGLNGHCGFEGGGG